MKIRLIPTLSCSLMLLAAIPGYGQKDPEVPSMTSTREQIPVLHVGKVTVKKLPASQFPEAKSSASLLAGGNLVPYQPPEWDNIIVLSTGKGTNTTSPTIYNNQLIYIDCSLANLGDADITETFYLDFLIDGVSIGGYHVEGLPSGYGFAIEDAEIWPISSGSHVFKVIVDSEKKVTETDETDNEYSRSKSVSYREPCINAMVRQPEDWDEMIITSTEYGTSVSAQSVNSNQPLYVDWSFANIGGCDISQGFDVVILVDDTPADTFFVESLASHVRLTVFDREIGPLPAGNHTIKVVVDHGNSLNEFDETDNVSSKSILISQAAACMNVTPYQPAGWDKKMVLSTSAGNTTTSATFHDNQPVYLDWAVINNGSCSTVKGSKAKIYLDDEVISTQNIAALVAGGSVYGLDVELGMLQAGEHTIRIVADADGELIETNENDNEYTVSITVTASACANLTPYQPAEWDDVMVLSTEQGTLSSATVFTTNDVIYIDVALINNGTCDIADTFMMAVYIDNVFKKNILVEGLFSGYYGYINDLNFGKQPAGLHTYKLVSDNENKVSEANEGDNEYTRTITVVPQTGEQGTEGASKIRIYPNPFTDNLMIELNGISGPADVEIYNASGLKVLSDRFTQRILLPCSDLKPGIYLVRIYDGNSVYWRKTIRE